VNNKGKFLNSIYRDETITLILEEAINGDFELTFIDRDTGYERKLLKKDFVIIRHKGASSNAEIETVAASSRLIAGSDWIPTRRETINFARSQPVGYGDLRGDEINLKKITITVGPADKLSGVRPDKRGQA